MTGKKTERDTKLVELRASGVSVEALAERYGLARRTVLQRLDKAMKRGQAKTTSRDRR